MRGDPSLELVLFKGEREVEEETAQRTGKQQP